MIYFSLFHGKSPLVGRPSTEVWGNRLDDDFEQQKAIESDLYYSSLFAYIKAALRSVKGANTFLEVGCYYGYRANLLAAEMPEKKFSGIDISADAIAYGRSKLELSPNLTLSVADACDLPYGDRSIDVVYSVVSLSHVPHSKIQSAMKDICRVSASKIILTEVDFWSWGFNKRLQTVRINYMYFHKYRFMQMPGFMLEKVTSLNFGEQEPRYTCFYFSRIDCQK